ncbi:YcgL domain-containing protein [Porticoccaceae bacterium]|jgi:uncharacterized protein YcgL (UPF0745 family)|nr:YcgL domain-containing protein [Porticoccaceae bacterium]MDB3967360.1 YcgL domain-containing protein [Porticoccaceae bacterium]
MTNTSKNSSSEQSKESRVLCDIYKGNKKEEMYLYVNKSDGLEKVPEALLSSFGELAQVTTLVLSKTRKLARADILKVLEELRDKGFYLQMPPPKYPTSDQPPSSINKYG